MKSSSAFIRAVSTSAGEKLGSNTQKKLVIFGGQGYVGSNIVKYAKQLGTEIVSVSRSAGQGLSGAEGVTWVKGDLLAPNSDSWVTALEGAEGAVTCVGGFGSNDYMEKVNGDANINAVSACLRAGVKRFTFISTVDNNLPEFVLKGYFNGKRRAEVAILDAFSETGTVLRPSFIYGDRQVGNHSIPLGLLGRPLETILTLPGFNKLKFMPCLRAALTPPVSVENVSIVAVHSALGETLKGEVPEELLKYFNDNKTLRGTISAEDISKLARILKD